MKKIISIILIGILGITIIAFTLNNSRAQGTVKNEAQKDEITIILPKWNRWEYNHGYTLMMLFSQRFSYQTGTSVRFIMIEYDENYISKRNEELYANNGPTLIFIPFWTESYKDLANKGIGINVKGKIPNYDKIYDSLKDEDDVYVPIGMSYIPMALNADIIKELGIEEPTFDWTYDDYLDIRNQWLNKEPRYFDRAEFDEIVNNPIQTLDILDVENKRVYLNTEKVRNYMKEIKNEIFSGKYILDNDYTYGNFLNLLYNRRSPEAGDVANLKSLGSKRELLYSYNKNCLNTMDAFPDKHQLVLPEVRGKVAFSTWGFLVNKRGHNYEMGLDFLNRMLSDESQYEMFITDYYTAPVNRDVEDDIRKKEEEAFTDEHSVKLRQYMIEQIKAGNINSTSQLDEIYYYIEDKFEALLVEYVFNKEEPLTEEELNKRMQRLEDELNLWINE